MMISMILFLSLPIFMITISSSSALLYAWTKRQIPLLRKKAVRSMSTRDTGTDEYGRRTRKRLDERVWEWDHDHKPQNKQRNGGWDDFDPFEMEPVQERQTRQRTKNNQRDNYSRSRRSRNRSNNDSRTYRKKNKENDNDSQRKTNMKALEKAGFVHLYGISSCLNALKANRRDFTRPEDFINLDDLNEEDLEHEIRQRERKPEAQFSPSLFVQDSLSRKTTRSNEKAKAAEQVEAVAKERNLPIHKVDKGVLNTLSGNRPHQGFVLRCGKLNLEPIAKLPLNEEKKLWLCLDEVVDPQNLGALIRSAYFLSSSFSEKQEIGIIVCGKNSAPPSPVVSAASAGALELCDLYSTTNLPKLLAEAKQNGFRIVGASSSVPKSRSDEESHDPKLYELQNLPPLTSSSDDGDLTQTILVLGSEGHGLRMLVAKACTEFVRIPGGTDAQGGVDSLNVSVTGGILLWHLLHGK